MKQDELFNERKTQMAEKMNKYQTEKEVEQMYAELWEQDRILKAKREEEEAKLQMERNREMVEVVNSFVLLQHHNHDMNEFRRYDKSYAVQ